MENYDKMKLYTCLETFNQSSSVTGLAIALRRRHAVLRAY